MSNSNTDALQMGVSHRCSDVCVSENGSDYLAVIGGHNDGQFFKTLHLLDEIVRQVDFRHTATWHAGPKRSPEEFLVT